jgi:hypothetical protein
MSHHDKTPAVEPEEEIIVTPATSFGVPISPGFGLGPSMTPLFGASYLLTDQPELHEDAKCELDESENDNTKPVTPWPTEAELTA